MFKLLLIMLLSSVGLCSAIEEGWRGIKPLETDKISVDKLLGNPETIDENGYHNYRTDDAFIQVNYTSARCKHLKDYPERGKYDVEKLTVLSYTVNLKKKFNFSELEFDRKDYVKEFDMGLRGNVYYSSVKYGILIYVSVQEENEYLQTLYFNPNEINKEKFRCHEQESMCSAK